MPDQSSQSTKDYVDIESLKDIPLNLKVELGKAKVPFDQILQLQKGSVVELDRSTSSPVDVYINNKLAAKGELIVIENNFAVRIVQIIK